jgi:hypothetical protein
VTGSFPARSRSGFGSAASVASTSAVASAHNFFQFPGTPEVWRALRAGATFHRFAQLPPVGCKR